MSFVPGCRAREKPQARLYIVGFLLSSVLYLSLTYLILLLICIYNEILYTMTPFLLSWNLILLKLRRVKKSLALSKREATSRLAVPLKFLQMFLIVLIKDIFVRLTQVIHSDSQLLITHQILLWYILTIIILQSFSSKPDSHVN